MVGVGWFIACAEFIGFGRFWVLAWNWACVEPVGVAWSRRPPAPVRGDIIKRSGPFRRSLGLCLIGEGGGGCAAFKRSAVRRVMRGSER